MATKAAPVSELSDKVEFSGEIAKKHHRSKNSSRFSKCTRKRFRDKSCSDSDDGTVCTPLTRRHLRKEEEPSGYSSSEEQSERGPQRVTYEGTSDDELDTQIHSVGALRKRRSRTQENFSKVDDMSKSKISLDEQCVPASNSPKGWVIIGESSRYTDLSVTGSNESSDDFWKCDSQTKLIRKESTTRQKAAKRTDNNKSVAATSRLRKILQWRLNLLGMARCAKNEWKSFKTDYQKDWRVLKQQYHACSIGLMIIFIYCGIGGIIFHSTEGAFEMFYKCGVKRVKRDFLDSLYTKRWLSEDEWKSLARTKLMAVSYTHLTLPTIYSV